MPDLVRGDLDCMIQLKGGLFTSAHKYQSEASELQKAARALEQASETNAHELSVENAMDVARRLEAIGLAIEGVMDALTAEIDRLVALVELTRRI